MPMQIRLRKSCYWSITDIETNITKLSINNVTVRFKTDSGAAVTTVSTKTLRQLWPKSRLRSTELSLKISTFCKTDIPVVGVMSVSVNYKNVKKNLNMYISDVDREPLLEREWIRQLKIQLYETIDCITKNGEKQVESNLRRYHSLLDPTNTKIRGIQANLTCKENASPVFLKAV